MTDTPASSPAIAENTTGARIVAMIVDTLAFVPVFMLMAKLFGEFGREDGGSFQMNLNNGPLLLFFLIWFAYFAVAEMRFGQTLGKKAMGLRVVAESGEPASIRQVLIRNALRVVDILPFFYIIGLITAAVSAKHQRIGDLAAKTIVVKR